MEKIMILLRKTARLYLVFFAFSRFLLLFFAPMFSAVSLPISDHFDGKKFFNTPSVPQKSFWDLLRWRLSREVVAEETYPPFKKLQGPIANNPGNAVVVTWIGHATFVVASK